MIVPVNEWQWLQTFAIAVKTAEALVFRSPLPDQFLSLNSALISMK
jgi:hypothetical protein